MSEEETYRLISDWIRSKSSKEFDFEANLLELGVLDSLLFAELISHLEMELKVSLDFFEVDDWSSIFSVTGLGNYIERQRDKSA